MGFVQYAVPSFQQIVDRDPIITSPKTRLGQAIAQLRNLAATPGLFIVKQKHLVGFLPQSTLLRSLACQSDLRQQQVRDISIPVPATLDESNCHDIFEAVRLLLHHHIPVLPVTRDKGHLVGYISPETLLSHLHPHPLLRRLTLQDISLSPAVTVTPKTSLAEAVARSLDARVNPLLVSDPKTHHPLGWLNPNDLLRCYTPNGDWNQQTVAEAMRSPLLSIPETASLDEAWQLIQQPGVTHLAVTGKTGDVLGCLSSHHLLQAYTPAALYQVSQQLEAEVNRLETPSPPREIGPCPPVATQLEQILDCTPCVVYVKDLQGRHQRVNAAFLELFDCDEADILGQTNAEFFPPETAAIIDACDRQVIEHENEAEYEETINVGGCDRVFLSSKFLLRNSHGQPYALCGISTDITDRKQAERAWQEKQRFFQQLIDASPNILYLYDFATQRNLYLNQEVRSTLGYTPQEIQEMGTDFLPRLMHPDDLQRLPAYFEQLERAEDGQIGEFEYRMRDASGQWRWMQSRDTVFTRNENGQIQQIIGAAQDISDRKRQEIALRESEAFRRTLTEVAPAGIFVYDLNLQRLVFCNSAYEASVGYSLDEIQALGAEFLSQLYHPETRDAIEAHDRAIIEDTEGKIYELEYLIRRKDGSSLRSLCREIVLNRNPDGTPAQILGVGLDVSDRRRAETALKERTAEFDRFFSLTLDLLCIANLDGEFLQLSQQWKVNLGYDLDELLGRNALEFVHPDDLEATQQALGGLQHGQSVHSFVNRYRRRDGSYCWLEWKAVPDDDRLYSVARDVSDRKNYEDTIRQQVRRESLLRQIGQRISQSLNLPIVFATACREIRAVLEADRVAIFQFDRPDNYNEGVFVAEARADNISSVLTYRVCDTCFGQNYVEAYQQGRFYVTADIYSDPSVEACHSDMLEALGIRANLVVPLLCGESLWGLLCVHQCRNPRVWSNGEVDVTQQLSYQLAAAIHQASLYERVQQELKARQIAQTQLARQLRQQQALAAITQRVRESLNLDCILQTVTQQVAEVLDADRVIVFRLFSDGCSRIVEETVAEPFPSLKDRHWEDESWSPEVLEAYWQSQPRIVPDVMGDRWTDCLREYSQAGQIRSKIVAPILQELRVPENHRWVSSDLHQKLWGVLVVHACGEKRVWQEEEAQLLQQIANQLALAIQQAGLFEALQQQLQERQQAQQLLTERNQQLAVSNKELARATRLKDEFLANMSHELRTPLNAILGMTEGLQEGVFGNVTAGQMKAFETVDRSASHLLELINEILDVAKIELGQIELDLHPTAIMPLCTSSMTFIKQQAQKKRLKLSIDLPQHLPDVLIDERRLRQVLINLLNNAVKFTPEGGSVTLAVSVVSALGESGENQSWLRLAVRDTGIGIAPKHIGRLFQPFVQIDSALNRQYTGTGLGLALVKRIVELHGGQVGVTSEVGVGSCFSIELPCAACTLETMTPAGDTSDGEVEASSTEETAPLLLLAEDNDANISTLSSYLQAKGFRLVVARDGREAIATAAAQQPDLILMDIQMPGMDGLEAIQHIRRDPDLAEIPIVALTALAMTGDRDRCLAAGATEYLSKPVKLKQLVLTVRQILGLVKT